MSKKLGDLDIEVLVRSNEDAVEPNLLNIGKFKPSSKAIEICKRWFLEKGFECVTTDFGLVCSAPQTVVVEVLMPLISFSELDRTIRRKYDFPRIEIPQELNAYVESIVIAVSPEFF